MAGFSSGLGALSAEVICEEKRPLKPVRCVCGEMIHQTGGPAVDLTVKVIKGGENIATIKTSRHSKFTFGEIFRASSCRNRIPAPQNFKSGRGLA